MLFLLPWPNMKGHLPVLTEFVVMGAYFDEAATAADVMQFDTSLIAATSYDIGTESSGVTTSAWGRVRDPDVNTALIDNCETGVYCVAKTTQAAATFGDVLVIGTCTLTKVTAATHTVGQDYAVSMAAAGKVVVGAAVPVVATDKISTAAHFVKIVMKSSVADAVGSAAAVTGKFNGFGWGVRFQNCAYNKDNTD